MGMYNVRVQRDRRFDGYGPSTLPNPLDDEVSALVASWRVGGPSMVAEAIAESTDGGRNVLRAYAERMASLAVRRDDPDLLLNAVIANVVGGLSANAHESLMVMAPIEDAATRIGVGVPGLFEDAAHCVGHPGAAYLMMWLTRSPENRSLATMRFVAEDGADGFRYVLRW
jgi:hypothetical protein